MTTAGQRESLLGTDVRLPHAAAGRKEGYARDARANRRFRQDRRRVDAGPPAGWKERCRFAERRLIDVAEISFPEWVSCMAGWLLNKPSAISQLEWSTARYEDKRDVADRRKTEWGTPLKGRERRYTAERRMIEVREVDLDQWLSSIGLN
jgi:hypothetical protein